MTQPPRGDGPADLRPASARRDQPATDRSAADGDHVIGPGAAQLLLTARAPDTVPSRAGM
ncbi:hypothetical protein [Streptomyces sp. NPDC055189]